MAVHLGAEGELGGLWVVHALKLLQRKKCAIKPDRS